MAITARSDRLRESQPERDGSIEDRYRALLAVIPESLLMLDANGCVVDARPREARAAAPAPNISARKLRDVLPEHVAEPALLAVRRVLESQGRETLAYSTPSAQGVAHYELRLAAASEQRVVAVLRDVTQQRLADAESAAHVARVEMLDAISQAFAGATLDYGVALDMAVRRTSELIGDLCIVAEFTGDELGLQPIAAHDRNAAARERLGRIFARGALPARQGMLEPLLDLGDTFLSNDLSERELVGVFGAGAEVEFSLLGAHALLAVPMRVLGRITGALLLLRHRTGRRYREEDVVFAQAIADRAAVAIHAAHLYAENQRQADALRSVNRNLEQRIAERTVELERANELLRQQATEDPLTGLANRRQLNAILELELRRARRQNQHLTLLLSDVDFFKRYNDHYGHPSGDECLRRVADVLKSTFRRAGDLVARYGGEEFAAVLPGCDGEAARVVAERFRAAVEALAIPHARSEVMPRVTVSVGVVSTRVAGSTGSDALLQAADQALYRSKAEGRNRTSWVVLELA